MTSKELKRMSRSELLQMLLSQMEENERLRTQLDSANAQLEDRKIVCANVGSIAEAALQLNGVFDAAERAAQQYLESVRELENQQDVLKEKLAGEAQANADAIIAQANTIMEEAKAYQAKAKQEADDYWQKVQNMVQNLLKEHQSLTSLLQTAGRK